MGQFNNVPMEHRRYWTDEDIEFLKENLGKYTIDEVAKQMNRSFCSVKNKVDRLGLGGYWGTTEYLSGHDITRMLGVQSRTLTEYWSKYGFRMRRRGKYFAVKQEYLVKFLKNHQDIWDASKVKDDTIFERADWFREKWLEDCKKKKAYFWTEAERSKLVFWYNKGLTYGEIAEKMGKTPDSLRNQIYYLRQNGVIY